ncbi:MAG: thiolase domain-containing protein, partial [Alphaproteobacteria bacterium]
MSACIVGWKHLKFGKHQGRDLESLIVEAAAGAIEDAGIGPADVDAIFIGTFNGGLVAQDFPASLVLQTSADLRFTPATRVENACATGSAAVYQGLAAIASGRARRALVVGVEKMTEVSGQELGVILTSASYVKEEAAANMSFTDIFARITDLYFQAHGDRSDALARIAAKNHRNGCANPMAHLQKDLGFEFCRTVSDKNPVVSGSLRRTDCSLVSDGAAALVLADIDTALAMRK